MPEKIERIRPADLKHLKMADEIGEEVIFNNYCCFCGKKQNLRTFKRRNICVNCLNFVKTRFN